MTERGHSSVSILAATSTSSLLVSSLTIPFDVIKNNQIASLKRIGFKESMQSILRIYGLKGLWRGYFPSLATSSVNNLVYFTLYENFRPFADQNFGSFGAGLAASVSRIISVSISSPFERFKTAIQANGSGSFALLGAGVQGIRATILRDVIFSGWLFLVMEFLNEKLEIYGKWNARWMSGLIGVSTSVLITHPFDVMKTKLQSRNCCFGEFENRVFLGLKLMVKSEGLKELSTGLLARMGKLCPGFVIYISIYEFIKNLVDSY